MRSNLILILYICDQLLSELLPFSSGPFAIALIAICMTRFTLYRSVLIVVLGFITVAYCAGVFGAFLSGTPISAFFLATLALLAGMCVVGAGLRGSDSILITPRNAFIGVVLSSGFLLLSLFGWDAMSAMQGAPTNRGSGLYMEPSHYALFVMPLWLMAYNQRQYRPWLFVALALAIVTCFSTTLVAFMICAVVVGMYFSNARANYNLKKIFGQLITGAMLIIVAYNMSGFVQVAGEPMRSYIGSRVYGLINPDDADAYNLSSLVALQGIELAQLSFSESLGMGVGLGNLGTSSRVVDQSDYRRVINTITGGLELNLREGGLLANKLVGELGILVLVIPLLLLRYFRRLKYEADNCLLSYHGAVAVVLLILIFARGLSYFSAPACLAVFSLAGVLNRRAGLSSGHGSVLHIEPPS